LQRESGSEYGKIQQNGKHVEEGGKKKAEGEVKRDATPAITTYT